MVTAALKPDTAPIFTVPVEWFPTRYFRWQTFVDALLDPDKPYLLHTFNTMILVLVNVTGAVVSNSLVAYPFARLRFRGRRVLFAILIGTLLLPGPVLLIPQFLLFYNFGWYGTYLPLTVPSFAGNAFFIFLLRQYMRRSRASWTRRPRSTARATGPSTDGSSCRSRPRPSPSWRSSRSWAPGTTSSVR